MAPGTGVCTLGVVVTALVAVILLHLPLVDPTVCGSYTSCSGSCCYRYSYQSNYYAQCCYDDSTTPTTYIALGCVFGVIMIALVVVVCWRIQHQKNIKKAQVRPAGGNVVVGTTVHNAAGQPPAYSTGVQPAPPPGYGPPMGAPPMGAPYPPGPPQQDAAWPPPPPAMYNPNPAYPPPPAYNA